MANDYGQILKFQFSTVKSALLYSSYYTDLPTYLKILSLFQKVFTYTLLVGVVLSIEVQSDGGIFHFS